MEAEGVFSKRGVGMRRNQSRSKFVKTSSTIGLWMLAFSVTAKCSSEQPSVNEILEKVGDVYRGLESYQLVADVSVELAAVGDIRSPEGGRATSNFHQSTNSEIDLAARNPGKVHLQMKDDNHELLVVSDGTTVWTYLPKKRQYVEALKADAKAELPILSHYQDLLVNRYRGLSKLDSKFVMQKNNQMKVGKEKVDCYVLRMETSEGAHEIWVDKTRFIVWRSKNSSPAAQEGISLQKTTTVNLKSANMNTSIDSDLFIFKPPEKATKVQSLNVTTKW